MLTDGLCRKGWPAHKVIVGEGFEESRLGRREQGAMMEMDDVTDGCIVVDIEVSMLWSGWDCLGGKGTNVAARGRRSWRLLAGGHGYDPETPVVSSTPQDNIRVFVSDSGRFGDNGLAFVEDGNAIRITEFADGSE